MKRASRGLLLLVFGFNLQFNLWAEPAVWRNLGPSLGINVKALAIDPQNPSILYAGVDDQIYKSSDRGSNWFLASNGWPQGQAPVAIAVFSPNPSHVYAASGRGLYKSLDGGAYCPLADDDSPLQVLEAEREHFSTRTRFGACQDEDGLFLSEPLAGQAF